MAGLAAKAPGLGSKIWKAVTSKPAQLVGGGYGTAEVFAPRHTDIPFGTNILHALNLNSDRFTSDQRRMYFINAGLGAGGTKFLQTPGHSIAGITLLGTVPAKDAALVGVDAGAEYIQNSKLDRVLKQRERDNPNLGETKLGLSDDAKKWLIGGGVALAGLGGLAGYHFLKNRNNPSVRVKLPGVERETEINIPIRDVAISRSLQRDIGRDVRRTVREDNKSRRTKIDPVTRKRIPVAEYELKYGDTSVSPSQGGSVAESAAIRKVAASIRKLIHQPF